MVLHMIRESGLLVTLVAERNRLKQRDCIQQLELLVEADVRDLRPYRCEPGSTPLAFDLFVQPGHHPQAIV